MLAVVGCQAPNLFQRIGVEGGGGVVWSCVRWAVGCDALVVSCPRRVGSDTSSGCLAQLRGPFSSQDQRQEAKVKSEGKRTSSSSAGPGERQEKKRKHTTLQRLSPYSEIEEQ
eukprot:scaffold65219_cov60-Phaeocystis_antarctica.AAC.2